MKIEKQFRYADISMPIALSVQIDYIELGKNSSTSSFHQKSHGWVEDYSCYEWMNTRLPSSQQVVAKMPFT